MKKIGLILVLISISLSGFTKEINDTIIVVIDLKHVDTLGLKINIYVPTDLTGNVSYRFPKSIPGIYEYLYNHKP